MADEPKLQELQERLVKLESSNRRMKRTGAALFLLVIIGAGVAAVGQRYQPVDASRLNIRDKDGNIRAMLNVNAAGNSEFWMYDKNGDVRCSYYMSPGGQPVFALWKKNPTHTRLAFSHDAKGRPAIALHDSSNVGRALLKFDEYEQPVLLFQDKNAKKRMTIGFDNAGEPSIGMWDKNGKYHERLSLTD